MNTYIESESSKAFSNCQRELSQSLINLGVAVREGREKENIINCFDRLQYSLDQFSKTERMARVGELFSLSKFDVYILSVTYMNTVEPDTVEPYLNQTWYERGPSLSLERVNVLCGGGGDQKNTNVSYILTHSNLTRLNL